VNDISKICVSPGDPVRKAIGCIDRGRFGIALVTSDDGRLIGTITDGDIRRAILAGQDLDAPASEMQVLRRKWATGEPIVASFGTGRATLIDLMQARSVRQVPLLDDQGRVVDLAVLDELLPAAVPDMQAVIMAGGQGVRLRPLTEDLPKPMLPVGGRPLLEHIVEQLCQAGIKRVNLTTHYKPERIVEHFGDGSAFGVELEYVNEDRPLGTGGALGLISRPTGTQLVINGDILTQVDFRAMLAFHQENAAEMTVAVRHYEMQVPYGVVECDGARVTRVQEKPSVGYLVNAGIYLLEPSVYEFVPSGDRFNMTDLIRWLLDAGRAVVSFPVREYWLDIGEHADYVRAQDDVENGRWRR
jgi:dTDP-glucose pyrophosphorylase